MTTTKQRKEALDQVKMYQSNDWELKEETPEYFLLKKNTLSKSTSMTRIVLIGAPGSGKSTVGMALAAHLQWPFVDTDSLIELKESKKITDLFVDNGEEYFRKVEFETLEEVLQEASAVISLGGGAPISQSAQDALVSSKSTIVFLDVALATAAPRVGFNRDRPLLLGNPRAQWQALSDERRPIYEKLATQSIKVDDMTVDEIIAIIESNL